MPALVHCSPTSSGSRVHLRASGLPLCGAMCSTPGVLGWQQHQSQPARKAELDVTTCLHKGRPVAGQPGRQGGTQAQTQLPGGPGRRTRWASVPLGSQELSKHQACCFWNVPAVITSLQDAESAGCHPGLVWCSSRTWSLVWPGKAHPVPLLAAACDQCPGRCYQWSLQDVGEPAGQQDSRRLASTTLRSRACCWPKTLSLF